MTPISGLHGTSEPHADGTLRLEWKRMSSPTSTAGDTEINTARRYHLRSGEDDAAA